MKTILSIVGTRPEAIKMAPVIQELGLRSDVVNSVFVSTGQHKEMLDQVFQLFDLKPDINLGLMKPNQTLSQLTGALFEALDGVVSTVKPDWVLAQGDTTTVMVASLVSFYHRIAFGHVEAGLRSGDFLRPFPEELNRRIADLTATAYFAPTQRAVSALVAEGVSSSRIFQTGNTVVDALLKVASMPFNRSESVLQGIPNNGQMIVVTAHRRESFGPPFRELCQAVREIAAVGADQGLQIVFPVHLNPNVRNPVNEILAGLPNVHLLAPFDYFTMVHAMKAASLILTDSGGVQEEAPSLGVPVLVMRETTERPEGVEMGFVTLVGTDRNRIVSEALARLKSKPSVASKENPYGDGKAARRIVAVLLDEVYHE